MTANASPIRRILASAAALLMLQWNALAFGAGGLPIGTEDVDRLAPAGHAEPILLPEGAGRFAAKEPPAQDKAPPADGAAIVPSRAATRPADPRPILAASGEALPPPSSARAFDARGPPRRA